jgi:GTP-binding protein
MKTIEAKFVQGVIGSHPILADGIRTVAFAGRSNVGKSSVINSLVGSRDLVRSSSQPGQTQQINYFLVNGDTYFADLPGYGYAKLSLMQREKLRKLLLWFLTADEVKLDAVVLVVDSKVGLKDIDYELVATAQEQGRRVIIVANKIDKANQSEASARIQAIEAEADGCTVIPYSALTHIGRETLRKEVLG